MVPMEDTDVYARASSLSDIIYLSVVGWPFLAPRTFGAQRIDSIDSVGANLVEGDGRGPGLEVFRFFRIARFLPRSPELVPTCEGARRRQR